MKAKLAGAILALMFATSVSAGGNVVDPTHPGAMGDGTRWDLVAYVHCDRLTHCTLELMDNPANEGADPHVQVLDFVGTDGNDSATAKVFAKIAEIQSEFTVWVNTY